MLLYLFILGSCAYSSASKAFVFSLYNVKGYITPQGIGKGIKKEKILFGLVFIACACINPGIEFTTLA